ncbi:hypothetical protein EK21DRAFT_87312 [Setomelanomma holmii]|uniref:Transmembrane protein n=1 Tax=Setomelanomma holmii TaxID=210430 RepID=A0A9P4HC10_9PLEO|nr:hypothetical protein EK21DRAFT_87312 [Setomelanomma holmii]
MEPTNTMFINTAVVLIVSICALLLCIIYVQVDQANEHFCTLSYQVDSIFHDVDEVHFIVASIRTSLDETGHTRQPQRHEVRERRMQAEAKHRHVNHGRSAGVEATTSNTEHAIPQRREDQQSKNADERGRANILTAVVTPEESVHPWRQSRALNYEEEFHLLDDLTLILAATRPPLTATQTNTIHAQFGTTVHALECSPNPPLNQWLGDIWLILWRILCNPGLDITIQQSNIILMRMRMVLSRMGGLTHGNISTARSESTEPRSTPNDQDTDSTLANAPTSPAHLLTPSPLPNTPSQPDDVPTPPISPWSSLCSSSPSVSQFFRNPNLSGDTLVHFSGSESDSSPILRRYRPARFEALGSQGRDAERAEAAEVSDEDEDGLREVEKARARERG